MYGDTKKKEDRIPSKEKGVYGDVKTKKQRMAKRMKGSEAKKAKLTLGTKGRNMGETMMGNSYTENNRA